MRKPSHYLSGRVKTNSPTSVDADRYSYLSLENAEPNLGSPTANNGMLISSDIGLRQWVQLGSGISIENGELIVDTANVEVIETIISETIANTDLQTATDFGNITTNNIVLNGSDLVFDTGTNNITLTAATASTARTLTLPNASGELLSTGVGNLIYAGDPPTTGYDYYVTNGTSSYKLDATDAIAGYLQVDESTDDNNAYNILLMQQSSGGVSLPGGSTTTGRAAMVDNGGLLFNPGTNTLQAQNIVSVNGFVAADLIQATQTNTDITIRGNGQGHINLYDIVDCAPEYINLGHNQALYQTNSDRGVIIGYNDEANVTASSIQVGVEYQIVVAGTTTWTSIGAPNNTVGTVFTATGVGTGDGIAAPTSGQKRAFFGIDITDNKFKYIPDATVVNNDTYLNMAVTGDLGDAAFRNLTVEGGLLVNGNTTTITAESLQIEDPIIFIGNSNNAVDDNLDRGIVFNYNDGDPKQGFMGWDDSEGKFVLYNDGTESGGVYTPTLGILSRAGLQVKEFESSSPTELCKYSASIAAVTIGRDNSGGKFTFANPNPQGMKIATSSTTGTTDLKLETDTNHRIHLDSSNTTIRFDISDSPVLTLDASESILDSDLNLTGTWSALNGLLRVGQTGGSIPILYTSGVDLVLAGGAGSLQYASIELQNNGGAMIHGGATSARAIYGNNAGISIPYGVWIEGGNGPVNIGTANTNVGINLTTDVFVDSNSTLYTDVITNYDDGLFLLSAAPGTIVMEISGPNETDGTVPTPVIITGGSGTSSTVVGGDVEISGGNAAEANGVVKIEDQIFPGSVGSNNQILEVVNSTTGQLGWADASSTSDVLQNITAEENTNTDRYITFVDATTGAQEGKADSVLKYNSANETLSVNTTTIKTSEVRIFGGTGSLIFEKYGNHNGNIELKDTSTGALTLKRGGVTYIDIAGSTNSVKLTHQGNVKLETNSGGVDITGTLTATAKSFLIDHPTKEGMKLKHGSLEGPENGVYVRGRLKGNNIIELPEYWLGLVDEDTITVELTPIGKHQKLFVKDIAANAVLVGNDNLLSKEINCFYTVYGERKDIDKMVVEYDAK